MKYELFLPVTPPHSQFFVLVGICGDHSTIVQKGIDHNNCCYLDDTLTVFLAEVATSDGEENGRILMML